MQSCKACCTYYCLSMTDIRLSHHDQQDYWHGCLRKVLLGSVRAMTSYNGIRAYSHTDEWWSWRLHHLRIPELHAAWHSTASSGPVCSMLQQGQPALEHSHCNIQSHTLPKILMQSNAWSRARNRQGLDMNTASWSSRGCWSCQELLVYRRLHSSKAANNILSARMRNLDAMNLQIM